MTNKPDYTTREATREDIAAVIAMLADDALGYSRESPVDPPAKCYDSAFDAMDADPRNEFFVLDIDGAVNGCLQLTYIPGFPRRGMERAQIESVRVSQELRGRGLGRKHFEWAIARARRRRYGLVQMTTDKERWDARGFYESLGFVASHEGLKLPLDRQRSAVKIEHVQSGFEPISVWCSSRRTKSKPSSDVGGTKCRVIKSNRSSETVNA